MAFIAPIFYETQNPSGNFCGHVLYRILFKLDKTVENGNILTALIFYDAIVERHYMKIL